MNKLEYLEALVAEANTDIGKHGYLPTFAEHLPDKCRSMLEIGIAYGGSAEVWDSFYGFEELDLHYIDLFQNPEFVSPRWCRNRGFVPHIGSQADIQFLSTIKEQFEVALDDGGHIAAHMIASFKHLFVNNLVSGGVYFITDCHCNKEEFYWGEGVTCFEDTPLWVMKNYLETGRIESKFFNEGESEIFQNLIKSVHICCDEKIIVIKKK